MENRPQTHKYRRFMFQLGPPLSIGLNVLTNILPSCSGSIFKKKGSAYLVKMDLIKELYI